MLYGEIARQRLRITKTHVVADTIDYLEAKFVFSDDWNGLEKWAHFANGDTVYDIRLTEDCIRKEDHLNLSAGVWKVYLHGNEFADGKVVERITTCVENLRVYPTGSLNGEPFPEMPASVTEQILARLEDIEQNGTGGGSGTVTSVNGVAPDENGNVEIPTSEQVQPDWNQNDATAADYVKNRTHSKVIEFEAICTYDVSNPNNTTSPNGEKIYHIYGDMDIPEGEYTITDIDGNEYSMSMVSTDSLYVQKGEYTNSFGVVTVYSVFNTPQTFDNITFKAWGVYATASAPVGDIWGGIAKIEKATYNTLSENYIPDSIARKADIPEGGASSWNDLTDKPFEAEFGEVDIIPEQQVTFANGEALMANVHEMMYDYYSTGIAVVLVINGDEYEGTLQFHNMAAQCYCDFGVYYIMGEYIELRDGSAVQDGDTATIRLYTVQEVIKTLDEKFLPEHLKNSLSYAEQELSENEKTQARKNIDASSRSAGVYNSTSINTVLSNIDQTFNLNKMELGLVPPKAIAIKFSGIGDSGYTKVFVPYDEDCVHYVPVYVNATECIFFVVSFAYNWEIEEYQMTIRINTDLTGEIRLRSAEAYYFEYIN